MKNRNFLFLVALVFSIISHLLVLLQISLSLASVDVPVGWHAELIILVGISLALSVGQFLSSHNRKALAALFFIRVILFMVATFPLKDWLPLRIALLGPLVFEAVIYLGGKFGIGVAALPMLFSFLLSISIRNGWRGLTDVSFEKMLLAFFYPLLITAVAFILAHLQQLASERETLVGQLRKASASLVETNIKLLDQIVKGEEQARSLERDRISRELHDTIGYTLMNIIAVLKASVELSKKDAEKTREFLHQGIEQAQKGLSETREALAAMRSAPRGRTSIVKAIDRLANAFKATHIRVLAHFSDIPWFFGEEIDPIIYRIVQEGITNAIHHGNANEIEIHLSLDAGVIMITINDNGCGATEISFGIGLSGIRERLRQVRGEMAVENIQGGFRLYAWIPFERNT